MSAHEEEPHVLRQRAATSRLVSLLLPEELCREGERLALLSNTEGTGLLEAAIAAEQETLGVRMRALQREARERQAGTEAGAAHDPERTTGD